MPSEKAIAFKNQVMSQLNQVAPVTARAMFGGYGLYSEGIMFALIASETLYFKVDTENQTNYIQAGMGPFVYERHGKPIEMSYFQLPGEVLANPEQLLIWVGDATAAARRSKPQRTKRRKFNPPSSQIQPRER